MIDDTVLEKNPTAATAEAAAAVAPAPIAAPIATVAPAATDNAIIFANLVRELTTSSLKNAEPGTSYDLLRAGFEKPLFEATMQFVHNNQVQAAKILGISRGTLRKRLKEFGML